GSGKGWVSSSYIKIGEKKTSGGGKTSSSGRGDAKLASVSRAVANEMQTTGWCAKGVNTAIRRHYGYNAYGNGNQVDDYLISNGNFKKLNYSLNEALSIPGVIMTWEKTGTTAGQKYGHTAISQGNGKDSTCDFYEYNTNTKSSKRTGFKCFLHNDYV
ncbi:MAG: LysM domain-containing protein, partial [Proteobacteria bacterium]|nr:LysM domain-containing protein [Pseudomonadota bacterium]